MGYPTIQPGIERMPLVLALHLRAGASVFDGGASWPCGDADRIRVGGPLPMGARYPRAGRHRARGDAAVMNVHQRWTQTNIDDLRCGIANGVEVEAIAEALDRTVEDIRAMTSRLRLRVAAQRAS